MELQKSNTNFGMAYISPKNKDLKHFQKYMSSVTGKIDVKAMGDFVIQQSKNKNVNLQYKHTRNGDFFEVCSELNPNKVIKVPCQETKPGVKNNFINILKEFYNDIKPYKFETENTGSWDNLPAELKKAGEIANKMEQEIVQ